MVTREGIRRIAALLAIVFAAAAVAACGDSDSTPSGTSPEKEVSSASGGESEAGSKGSPDGGSRSKQGGGKSSGSNASVDPAPLEVSGGGAAQYRTAGGDNSIQEFGEESEEGELEEAAIALHDYLVARAEEDWPAACAHLARTVTDQLDMLASQSGNLKGKGCAGILEVLTPPLPPAVRRESTVVDAGSLRLEDEQAFLIYRGAKDAEYAIVMADEDGAWKVGALTATPLS